MGTTNTTSYDEVGTFELEIDTSEKSFNQLYRINTKTGKVEYHNGRLGWQTKR